MESEKIKVYQQQQQKAWDDYVKQRTTLANSYALGISRAKQSSYEPLKIYASGLPSTLEELCPSLFLPMQEYVSDEEVIKDKERYNEVARTINAFNDEIMNKIIEANKKFEEVYSSAKS